MKSWKTTLGGLLAAAGASLMGAAALDWLTPAEKHAFMLVGFILTIVGPIIMGLAATDHSHTKRIEADVKEVKAATDFIKKTGPAVLILSCLLSFGTGCHQLAPGGVYAGDKVLYEADLVISSSYNLLHTFVKWEYDNRAMLAGSPEIRRAADAIRTEAPRAFQSAVALRDAYHAQPGADTRDALTTALAVLRQMTTEATKYLAGNPAAPSP